MTRRVRKFVLLAVVVAVIGGGGAGAYEYHKIHRAHQQATWRRDGIAATNAGDYKHAVDLLTQYLKVHSEDPEALRAYIKSSLAASGPSDPQTIVNTAWAYDTISRMEPLKLDEHLRLLQLQMTMGDVNGVIRVSNDILKKHPDEPAALEAKTRALIQQHEWTKASQTATHWSQIAQENFDAQLMAIAAMQQAGATPREIATKAVELRRGHAGNAKYELLESVALTLANLPSEPQDVAKPGQPVDSRSPTEWAKLAASHAPADLPFVRSMLPHLDRLGLFDEAIQVLQKAVAENDDAALRRALCRRLWETSNWAALDQTLAGIKIDDTKADPEFLCFAGIAESQLKHAEKTDAIRKALTARASDPIAKGWLSMLDQLTGRSETDARKSVVVYREAAERDPQNPYFHYFLADALIALGENDLALRQLHYATGSSTTWAAAPAKLADLMLQQSRVEAAIAAAGEAEHRASRDGKIHDVSIALVIARARMAALSTGRTDDASTIPQWLETVQRILPGEDQTLGMQVTLRVRAGDKAGAAQLLSAAIANPKLQSEANLLRYAAISQRVGLGLEEGCFDRCEKQFGLTPELVMARATRLLAKGEAAKGLELLKRGAEQAKAIAKIAWDIQIAAYLDAARDPGARAAWISLADAHPDSLAIQQAALHSPAANADRDFVDRSIERLRKLTGDEGLQWKIARARWLLDNPKVTYKDLQTAADSMREAVRVSPESVDARLLLASSLLKLHKQDEGVEQLKYAAALRPDSFEIAMQLVQLLEDDHKYGVAEAYLMKFTKGPLANPTAFTALGWLEEQDGSFESAEQNYRKALAMNGDLGLVKNNLAMLLLKKGNAEGIREALRLASDAAKSNPQPAVLDTLAVAQSRSHDFDSALATIAKAVAMSNSTSALQVRQIELMSDAGRFDAARLAFAQLQTKHPELFAKSAPDAAMRDRLLAIEKRLAPSTQPASLNTARVPTDRP